MADIIEVVKMAALEAIESTKPAGVYFGTVISISPLKIIVDQRMTLESKQLILARNVTDFYTDMTVDHLTENETQHTHGVPSGGSTSPTSHLHAYMGRKMFLVHNGLVNGDKVLLMRVQGGQKYVVWDRVT